MFDGDTYQRERDGARLQTQLEAVRNLMMTGSWFTLPALRDELQAAGVHASEAAVSARVRDLRKDKFGGFKVDRRHVANGLFEYRVVLDQKAA